MKTLQKCCIVFQMGDVLHVKQVSSYDTLQLLFDGPSGIEISKQVLRQLIMVNFLQRCLTHFAIFFVFL